MTSESKRTFGFENEFVSHLRCIPMAVRRKLDLAGVKLKLAHWNKLSQEDREAFLALDVTNAQSAHLFREQLVEAVRAAIGDVPKDLPVPELPPWMTAEPPDAVRETLLAKDIQLESGRWLQLSELERFALTKLCRPSHESDNLIPALREFGLIKPQS